MKLHELREARAAKVGRMRALQTAAANDGSRALTDAEQREFDSLETETRSLNQRITNEERTAELERTASATPLNDNQPGDFAAVERRGSLRRAIAIASGMEAFDGVEKEIHDELQVRSGRKFEGVGVSSAVFMVPRTGVEQRVMTSGSGGVGLIPTEQRPQDYIDALRANLVTARLGATVLSGLQGNVSIPKNTGNRTGQWIAENAALTAVD